MHKPLISHKLRWISNNPPPPRHGTVYKWNLYKLFVHQTDILIPCHILVLCIFTPPCDTSKTLLNLNYLLIYNIMSCLDLNNVFCLRVSECNMPTSLHSFFRTHSYHYANGIRKKNRSPRLLSNSDVRDNTRNIPGIQKKIRRIKGNEYKIHSHLIQKCISIYVTANGLKFQIVNVTL